MSHNNLSVSSIFVTSDGTWKLWGLEYCCRYAPLYYNNNYCAREFYLRNGSVHFRLRLMVNVSYHVFGFEFEKKPAVVHSFLALVLVTWATATCRASPATATEPPSHQMTLAPSARPISTAGTCFPSLHSRTTCSHAARRWEVGVVFFAIRKFIIFPCVFLHYK